MQYANPNQWKLKNWLSQLKGAVEGYDKVALQRLLEHPCATRANVSAPLFGGGQTALHHLAMMSPNQKVLPKAVVEMAQMLTRAGANLDAKDDEGLTPLDYLKNRSKWAVILQLLEIDDEIKNRRQSKVA